MNFYQSIFPLIEYLHSIRKMQDYLSIDLVFPSKWSLTKNIKDEVEVVPFNVEDTTVKGVSFVCKFDEETVVKTMDKIFRVIKLNKERELKEVLFKHTIEELKKTFEQNDLDKLQNLYFDFATEDAETSNLEIYESGKSEAIELAE